MDFVKELLNARKWCVAAKNHDVASREYLGNIAASAFALGAAGTVIHTSRKREMLESAMGNLSFGDLDAAAFDIQELLSSLDAAKTERQLEYEANHA